MPTFSEIVRLVTDGDPVSAGVTNRGPITLDQNVKAVRDMLIAAMMGQTLFARDCVIETALKPGMPVYYNDNTAQFERALGTVATDPSTGAFTMSPSSIVWGIVFSKSASNVADVLLHGVADIDMSQAIDGDPVGGAIYYLSNAVAGKLVRQQPPVGIAVLQIGPAVDAHKRTVYVNSRFQDLLDGHRHYKFPLVAAPAGNVTPPAVGENHVITSPDSSHEGWLPASHAVFDGKAPAGAKFGYNLSASKLGPLWPPQPVEGAYLEWSKGVDHNILSMGVPTGAGQLVILDRHGIWWMSNCYDDVPWATDFDTSGSLSDSGSLPDCPRQLVPQLSLWFSKPVFSGSGTWVSQLAVTPRSGLILTCPDTGEAATTGPLLLDFDSSFLLEDTNVAGYQVVKTLDGKRLVRGPVVSGLRPGSNNVVLTGGAAFGTNGTRVGPLTITVDQGLDGREVDVDIARLQGVDEEFFEGVIALGFAADRLATIRGRIQIPAVLDLPLAAQMKFRLWVVNRSNLTVPAELFTMSYRRIGQPSALLSPVNLPLNAAEVALAAIPAADVPVTAVNQYFAMETESFTIAAGETILFSLSRAGNTDGFNSDVHLLRMRGIYVLPS